MNLGSKVGLIVVGVLILTGIILCTIGVNNAKKSGQSLFAEINEDGTYYSQTINESVTKLSVDADDVNVTVKVGDGPQKIEVYNFNPNMYNVSSTSNVMTFDEAADLKSLVNVFKNGLSFKGLRYLLDFRNFNNDGLEKRIEITLSPETSVKIIDISVNTGRITAEGVKTKGDMLLSVLNGEIGITDTECSSMITLRGDKVKASLDKVSAGTFKMTVGDADVNSEELDFTESQITVQSGRIAYNSAVDLSNKKVSVSTKTGVINVNTQLQTGAYVKEPDKFDNSLQITTDSADVTLTFPVTEKGEKE